jgi:hypothetical protein
MFWGGTVVENFMQAWGEYDNHIPGTELEEERRRRSVELEDKARDTYKYIANNMFDIIGIILYTLPNVKAGIYSRKSKNPGIWDYQPFENNSNN